MFTTNLNIIEHNKRAFRWLSIEDASRTNCESIYNKFRDAPSNDVIFSLTFQLHLAAHSALSFSQISLAFLSMNSIFLKMEITIVFIYFFPFFSSLFARQKKRKAMKINIKLILYQVGKSGLKMDC